jgi:hypothetical protein
MNHIIEALKRGIERLNPDGSQDYKSGFNDGAYILWRYLFEPTSVPPEIRQDAENSIRQAQKTGFTITEVTWEDIITHGVEDKGIGDLPNSVQECDATKVK